jgi:GT2 family glycosyltransferase
VTTDKTLLTIVIPTHQRTDLLVACIQSLIRYRSRAHRIIVVDDGSPNGRASGAASSHPDVEVVRLSECRGFCAAVNAGIRAATTEFVQALNDDTEVRPGWDAAALAVFRERRDVAAVAPLVVRWPAGDCIDSAGDRYYIGGIAGKRGNGQLLAPEFMEPGYVFGASGCGAFYRRDALLSAGGFPEEFGAYFDDVDLSFRLRRAGHQIWYEPSCQVLHHGSASHGEPCGRLLEQQSRNEEWVFWRNMPTERMLQAVPKHLAVLAAKAYRRWRHGELGPFLRGRWAAITQARSILNHRRHLRNTRRQSADWHWAESWWGDK